MAPIGSQAVEYQLSFERCFELLASNPRMGRRSPTIRPDLRRHEHGSPGILYQEDEEGVLIVAVVHGSNLRGLKL
jgi:toxin ParE1/3/4